eukprot:scaffold25908_cov18-Tisochrysis_lutea.AAC.2
MKDTGGWHTGAAARTLRCLYETIMRVNLPMQVGRNQFPTQRYSLVRAVPLTGRSGSLDKKYCFVRLARLRHFLIIASRALKTSHKVSAPFSNQVPSNKTPLQLYFSPYCWRWRPWRQVGITNSFPLKYYWPPRSNPVWRSITFVSRHVHTQPSIKIFKPIRDRRQGRRRVSGPMEVSEEEPMQGSEETIYEDVYERNKEEQ